MRIRMLTGSAAVFICGVLLPEAAAKLLHAARMVVRKGKRTLELLSHRKVVKSYPVALGGVPFGSRRSRGTMSLGREFIPLIREMRTACFTSRSTSLIPAPEIERRRPRRESLLAETWFVHGLPNGYAWVGWSDRMKDWTDGSIAVTKEDSDEIWAAVTDGTLIEIRP